MRSTILILLFLTNIVFGQSHWYVAAKNGLNFREEPNPNSKVIQLLPYGTKLLTKYPKTYTEYTTGNFIGCWWEAEYQNKKGYVFEQFMFPFPPPDTNHNSLYSYITSFPIAFGPVENNDGNIDGDLKGEIVKTYMTTNGILYYESYANEFGSFVCMLPGFNIFRAFHLIRLFPDVKKLLGKDDNFPIKERSIQINEIETFSITLVKSGSWVIGITLRKEGDGYPEQIKIISAGGEIIIIDEGGSV